MRHKVFHKVKRGFERNQLAKNCEKKIIKNSKISFRNGNKLIYCNAVEI